MRREDSNFEESLEKTAGRRLVGGSDRGTDRHLTENPGRGADRHSERRLERNPGRRLARSLDKGEDRHLAERPEREVQAGIGRRIRAGVRRSTRSFARPSGGRLWRSWSSAAR